LDHSDSTSESGAEQGSVPLRFSRQGVAVSDAPGEPNSTNSDVLPPTRRAKKWIIGAVVAGLAAAVTGLVVKLVNSGSEALGSAVLGRFVETDVVTPKGPRLHVDVLQGYGCSSGGWVFPLSATQVQQEFSPPVTDESGEVPTGRKLPDWQGDPRKMGA